MRISAASDAQNVGGYFTVQGLNGAIRKADILSVTQSKSRAEVAQVATIGGTSYTPTANTRYAVAIYDPLRSPNGYNEYQHLYTFTTPAVITSIGANPAEQREAINLELIAKINAASANNHGTAVTLGSGNGFTFTDAGGYFPYFAQGQVGIKGANSVYTITNEDGSGFAPKTDASPFGNVSITTPAVYAVGIGADLITAAPVLDFVYGNVVRGVLEDAPLTVAGLTAVSGQNYDVFTIECLQLVDAITLGGQFAYQSRFARIYVDNGTGSSTTNLSGFLAFEAEMRKLVAETYSSDPGAFINFYDKPTLFQGAAGAVPTGTGENKIDAGYGQFVYNQIGTQTITTPTPGNTGLSLDQDATDTEGAEYTPSLLTLNKQGFVVGKSPYSFVLKAVVADHTDANFYVSLRRKSAHAADFNNYTDFAGVGFLADLVYTWGILNDAATVATNTTVVPTDAAYEEFVVSVSITGAVTVKRNGVSYPVYSAGTTPLVFDAGDEIIPSFRYTNVSTGAPGLVVNHSIAVAADWLS